MYLNTIKPHLECNKIYIYLINLIQNQNFNNWSKNAINGFLKTCSWKNFYQIRSTQSVIYKDGYRKTSISISTHINKCGFYRLLRKK
ncbi:hypothetical protein T11_1213 [Trichinella zimbabwensis]|uniref:Uncharacterized protein n=1 Tax=Trichinella zimbabwensis TaxID=268475 RepID=A0A0V1HE37_9BILA|nr:hypothetical protein T11_1213 [Trichinella zimbabwensis]